MFLRYVHTEDDPVRAAADAVAVRRQGMIGGAVATAATKSVPAPIVAPETVAELTAEADKPLGLTTATTDLGLGSETIGRFVTVAARTGLFPPDTKRTADETKDAGNVR